LTRVVGGAVFKNSIKRYLPPIVTENVGLVRAHREYVKNKDVFRKNKELYLKHKGESLLIIGNGPSLKKVDLSRLNHLKIFACNDFYLHKDFKDIKVDYFFNLDPREVWFNNVLKTVDSKTLDSMRFILPFEKIEKCKEYLQEIKHQNYVIHGGSEYSRYTKYLDLSKPILGIINILQVFLIAARYMGFKNVYLVGFDYSFLAYKSKGAIPHFHEKDERAFRPKPEKGEYIRVTCNAGRLFRSLEHLLSSIEKDMNVYNANYEDCYLDLFEELSLESLYCS